MWIIVFLLIIIAVAAILFRAIYSGGEPQDKTNMYVCTECGEKHCNCYLDENVE